MIGFVLGSGLGGAAQIFDIQEEKPLESVLGEALKDKAPPLGHQRKLLLGSYRGRSMAVMQGRIHYYEGFPMELVVAPMRLFKSLGVQTVVLSFAGGALRPNWRVRDLVLLKDQIHHQSDNPLRGHGEFVDCTDIFDGGHIATIKKLAVKERCRLKTGIYLSTDGPNYESPAEVRSFARWGADIVGMSVTAEALVARALGMRVVGLGWVSNMASGLIPKQKLSHHDVLLEAQKVEPSFTRLVKAFLETF
ncbi:MAG: purine-nucleoside phosphorylase [Elusimicrobia bacterium]|nr:purine-nucleoside phosphorylase [Elusimicrobiota bacterium]